jgi:mannose-6-phosphate isomerase-like protein (cupin superfamily)
VIDGIERIRSEKDGRGVWPDQWADTVPYGWSNGPGDEYAAHQHGYTKRLICAIGSITFRIGPTAEPVELGPGDGFILPAGTEHSASVGPAGCTCLEGRRG